jgi:hypothetical protein
MSEGGVVGTDRWEEAKVIIVFADGSEDSNFSKGSP